MTLYNLHSDGTITKWDEDGNLQAQYTVSADSCTCPAGHRHTCRHRQMLPLLLPICDTHWFLDWDNGRTIVDFSETPKSLFDEFEPARAEEDTAPVDRLTEQDTAPEGQHSEAQMLSTILGEKVIAVHEGVPIIECPSVGAKSWRRL